MNETKQTKSNDFKNFQKDNLYAGTLKFSTDYNSKQQIF